VEDDVAVFAVDDHAAWARIVRGLRRPHPVRRVAEHADDFRQVVTAKVRGSPPVLRTRRA
jgi:hypothetical protein